MGISNGLKKWLSKYYFDDVHIKKDEDFFYSYLDECIHWTLNNSEHDSCYLNFIKILGYRGNLDIKTISFLHELGHHELSYEYTDVDFFFERFKKYIEGECSNKFTLRLRAILYYLLPVEYKATKWMIDFVTLFPKESSELDLVFKGM